MCGIVGIFSQKNVATELYESLIHLQHRGQDTAGILTCDERMHIKIGRGRASEVFQPHDMQELKGNMGLAHLRYPTSGGHTLAEAQPLTTTFPYGIGLIHNGNIANYQELKELLKEERRYLNSLSDSEILMHYFATFLAEHPQAQSSKEFFKHICTAVNKIFELATGAYSIITSIVGMGMVVFRDPHGIRPLVMGARASDHGKTDYIFASEDIPFYSLGFETAGDIAPGEVVFIDMEGQIFRKILNKKEYTPCVFEYVYFARPDAIMNGISVYHSRLRMGQNLAKAWKAKHPEIIPDVVVPIPFTSNTPALAFARELGARYSEGLYKNVFIGRTFIMPTPEKRLKSVRTKLRPQVAELKDKKVLLLDDSIVRGTTSREIVKMVRDAGAKEVYLVSACPPVKFPCYYGIHIPTKSELIANQYPDEASIAQALDVDVLMYQTLGDLKEAVLQDQAEIKELCMACLSGCYGAGKPQGV
jgi:amidophosphoribosyltransferase